jgi:hypothetical protein
MMWHDDLGVLMGSVLINIIGCSVVPPHKEPSDVVTACNDPLRTEMNQTLLIVGC